MSGTGRKAVVIGGGFYGAAISLYLREKRNFSDVLLVEKESSLLKRASLKNQARVHNGYHYLRCLATASRSQANFARFLREWDDAIHRDFSHVYAIASERSLTSAKAFEAICRRINAPYRPASRRGHALFRSGMVENAYEVEEYAFDAKILAALFKDRLERAGIETQYLTNVLALKRLSAGQIEVRAQRKGGHQLSWLASHVFNCTYSQINQFHGSLLPVSRLLRHKKAHMVLLDVPNELRDVGITVMDGPFFSLMPFPSQNCHSLSHVRYTPVNCCCHLRDCDCVPSLRDEVNEQRSLRMLKDSARFVPALAKARFRGAFQEVKTVLAQNDRDHGRPILLHRHDEMRGVFSVVGGKLDNIYDIFATLDNETLQVA